MDLFCRHVEKIMLAGVLAGCLACSLLLYRGLRDARQRIAEVRTSIPSATEGPLLTALVPEEFGGGELLAGGPAQWRIRNGEGETTLFEPSPFVGCINQRCSSLVRPTQDLCRWCDTHQSVAPVVPRPFDTDGDRIPDVVENELDLLDPRDPTDADRDHDGDFFTNIEEFLAKTDLADARSHPPLAFKLRFLGLSAEEGVPVKFIHLERDNSPDKTRWSVLLRYRSATSNLVRTGVFHIGDQLAGCRISDIVSKHKRVLNPGTNAVEIVDVSELVFERDNGGTVTVVLGAEPVKTSRSARFALVTDGRDPADCPRITVRPNEPLILGGMAGPSEAYRIAGIHKDEQVVLLKRVNGTEHAGQEFIVAKEGVLAREAM